jgi:hypothetical protein
VSTKKSISILSFLLLFVVMTSGNVSARSLNTNTLTQTSTSVWGTGADGDLTVSAGQTIYTDNTRSALSTTAASGQPSLTLSSASGFAVGQEVLIIQMQGIGAGTYEFGMIAGISGNIITLGVNLSYSYDSDGSSPAQVLRVYQYHNVTVQSDGVLTAHAWDGSTGGVVAFRASGTITETGTISANGQLGGTGAGSAGGTGIGFRGGQAKPANGNQQPGQAFTGEGSGGASEAQTSANFSGGGGGYTSGYDGGSGGGGSHASAGGNGVYWNTSLPGIGATLLTGTSDLTTMTFGGGGGGAAIDGSGDVGAGGGGGGIVFITGSSVIVTGSITTNGGAGGNAFYGGGGGGAGGSILIKAKIATLGTNLITAIAGAGGLGTGAGNRNGGNGGVGRIRIDYGQTLSGTTNPPASTYQDPTLETYTLTYKAGTGGTITGTTPQTVNYGANGTTVTAKPNTGYHFVKWSDGVLTASRTDTNVTTNIYVTANFASITYTITGNVGITGVTLSYTDGTLKTATSALNGSYSLAVSYNWSGKVTPSKTGFAFSPASRTYSNVVANQTSQNYSTLVTISGNVGDAGVVLHYTNGTAQTLTSASNGRYSFTVPYHWSGTVTPVKTGVTFTPASRTYISLATSQTNQNYIDTVSFISTATYDGGIIESARGNGKGGTMNSTAINFPLGDDSRNRQFRLILSFNTGSLPDTAIIQSVALKIKQNGSPVGINPFTVLGALYADIRKGYFGTSPVLELADFNAPATATRIGSFGSTPISGWYSASLNATGKSDINKANLTQLRIYFATPTNNNNSANYAVFFSGNAAVGNQPLLIITYSLP